MEKFKGKKPRFSMVVSFAVLIMIGLVASSVIIASHQKTNIKQIAATSTQTVPAATTPVSEAATTQQPNTWNTYNDTGHAAASDITIKYAPDWKINIPGVKAVGTTQNPTAVINERVIFLASSETPKEEWDTCATNISADACGAAPEDTTLSSNEFTINGYAAYTATMQNSSGGTYHVTVIRGNKATSDGIPFVEFTTATNDRAVLNTYTEIMASAKFPN